MIHTYVYIYKYISLSLSIYIYIYIHTYMVVSSVSAVFRFAFRRFAVFCATLALLRFPLSALPF